MSDNSQDTANRIGDKLELGFSKLGDKFDNCTKAIFELKTEIVKSNMNLEHIKELQKENNEGLDDIKKEIVTSYQNIGNKIVNSEEKLYNKIKSPKLITILLGIITMLITILGRLLYFK